MRKILALMLSLFMICGFTGCNNSATTEKKDDSSRKNTSSFDNSSNPANTNNTSNNYTSSYYDSSVQYISDRRVQYDDANKRHIVFFGLKDSSMTYVSASGTASIIIKDETDTVLFKKDISFSSEDFTNWTNRQWDSARYMCGLYIKDSELQGSASTSGTLSLKVTLSNGVYFDAETLTISDLPSLKVKITIPSIPTTITDKRYSSYTSTVQISKLEYTSEMSYDGTAKLTFNVILKLVSKTGKTNESSSVSVGYKIYDSDGIVVDSGHIYSDPIAVGESSRDSFNVYDLNPRDSYTLKFENAS